MVDPVNVVKSPCLARAGNFTFNDYRPTTTMPAQSPFREVYVEIPTMRRPIAPMPVKSTPNGRKPLGLVPVVEIPHSPLWKGKQTTAKGKDEFKKIGPLTMQHPLRENILRKEVDVSNKRKTEEAKPGRGRPKKQRVEEVCASWSLGSHTNHPL